LTPLPTVQLTPVTVPNQPTLTLLTGTFLTDDSIGFLGGTREAVVPESQFVIKLDANGTNGQSIVELTNPNYSAKGLMGAEIAFNSSGIGASGQNLIDTGNSGYASIDLQIYAAGASGATDLGSVLTTSATPSAPGSSVVQQGVLADGTSLLLTRTGTQDVAALDTGIGTLVAASTGGWAARMLSRAGGNYAMIPGTLELLGVQQRSAAPWGFQDGVYLLAPPAVAVPTEAQRKPSR